MRVGRETMRRPILRLGIGGSVLLVGDWVVVFSTNPVVYGALFYRDFG